MRPEAKAALDLLTANATLSLAAPNPDAAGGTIQVRQNALAPHPPFQPVKAPPGFKITERDPVTLRPQIAMLTTLTAENPHQECYDEPIPMGVQIQPAGHGWVGTAGAPVAYTDNAGKRQIGILSNWHVMAGHSATDYHKIHQPTVQRAPIATLDVVATPRPAATNYMDAAIANALIDGKHTIDDTILQIGHIPNAPKDAELLDAALKAGRTTQVTTARCSATGAAVRVSYGAFTAIFADQDVYESDGAPFSAPGDSGSLIILEDDNRPLGLLFAGGGNVTIANPIRYLMEAFTLDFNL